MIVSMQQYQRHYEETLAVKASADDVFKFLDDHTRLTSHMSQSSWMMGGGKMVMKADEGRGQKEGSHIRLEGKVLGINIFLDEVVTEYKPPVRKRWETVGNLRLLVMGHYRMGAEINQGDNKSHIKIFIDYNLPSGGWYWAGYLMGGMYAKWCVRQMLDSVKKQFGVVRD